MDIQCKLLSCSNSESKGNREVGNENKLIIGTKFIFGSIISSKITNIKFEDKLIIINTNNSIYTFEIGFL